MKAKESYDDRLLMVEMHDDVISHIDRALEDGRVIEACWFCYACFENRITRTLEKVSEKCSSRKCYQNKMVGIRTKIDCLKRLSQNQYVGTAEFDIDLLGAIKNWCRLRNALVHELVTLNNYQEHERAFSDLAKEGAVLAKLLYSQTTHFRNVYYNTAKLPPFPPEAQKKCQLIKKTKQ